MELLKLLESTRIETALVIERRLLKSGYALKMPQMLLEWWLHWWQFGMPSANRMIHRSRSFLERSMRWGRWRWGFRLIRISLKVVKTCKTPIGYVIARIIDFGSATNVLGCRSHYHAMYWIRVDRHAVPIGIR
jgi:hypothetical protein